jgi:hypothetical protein
MGNPYSKDIENSATIGPAMITLWFLGFCDGLWVRISQRIGIDRAMREVEEDASLIAEYERALNEVDTTETEE